MKAFNRAQITAVLISITLQDLDVVAVVLMLLLTLNIVDVEQVKC